MDAQPVDFEDWMLPEEAIADAVAKRGSEYDGTTFWVSPHVWFGIQKRHAFSLQVERYSGGNYLLWPFAFGTIKIAARAGMQDSSMSVDWSDGYSREGCIREAEAWMDRALRAPGATVGRD